LIAARLKVEMVGFKPKKSELRLMEARPQIQQTLSSNMYFKIQKEISQLWKVEVEK